MNNSTDTLKVALVPLDITAGDIDANLAAAEKAMTMIEPDTDLTVLPEMFNSGFSTDTAVLDRVAEPDDGRTITTIKEWSRHYGFAIWGGFTGRRGNDFYNRGFMISPDGSCNFYNKRHLFRLGGEYRAFKNGCELAPVVDLKGWKLTMAICYDIRFPAWNRNTGLKYDALIVPANWAHSRVYAWRHMLIARAIENQAYVAGCNRSGKDEYGIYPADDTFAFNFMGEDIARKDEKSGIVYAVFDKKQLNAARDRFQAWMDADEFKIADL